MHQVTKSGKQWQKVDRSCHPLLTPRQIGQDFVSLRYFFHLDLRQQRGDAKRTATAQLFCLYISNLKISIITMYYCLLKLEHDHF